MKRSIIIVVAATLLVVVSYTVQTVLATSCTGRTEWPNQCSGATVKCGCVHTILTEVDCSGIQFEKWNPDRATWYTNSGEGSFSSTATKNVCRQYGFCYKDPLTIQINSVCSSGICDSSPVSILYDCWPCTPDSLKTFDDNVDNYTFNTCTEGG